MLKSRRLVVTQDLILAAPYQHQRTVAAVAVAQPARVAIIQPAQGKRVAVQMDFSLAAAALAGQRARLAAQDKLLKVEKPAALAALGESAAAVAVAAAAQDFSAMAEMAEITEFLLFQE
jgi:hypothetical protein